jgi:hypothetical protein
VQQQTAVCARGTRGYELRISIDAYQTGSIDRISAGVKMIDPDTQATVSEYYIQESRGGVGIVGLVNAVNGGSAIASDFAKSVCRRIFYLK